MFLPGITLLFPIVTPKSLFSRLLGDFFVWRSNPLDRFWEMSWGDAWEIAVSFRGNFLVIGR